jgi:hypothetical protein
LSGHGAAGVGAEKRKPERSLETQSSNVLKLKPRVASFGRANRFPAVEGSEMERALSRLEPSYFWIEAAEGSGSEDNLRNLVKLVP